VGGRLSRVGVGRPDAQVQGLDRQGEGHGEVDVPLVDVGAGPLGQQHHADQQQEGEGEHLQGGVGLDEAAHRLGEDHHHAHGQDDGGDHHCDAAPVARSVGAHHPHRGDHRVEGKDHVHHRDGGQRGGEGWRRARWAGGRLAFDALVDLGDALPDQEQAAGEQDQVLAGHRLRRLGQPRGGQTEGREVKQGGGETQHRRQGEEQQDARPHGQLQPQTPRPRRQGGGQPAGDDGDEDDVVDAQHDLQRGEGKQGDHGLHQDLQGRGEVRKGEGADYPMDRCPLANRARGAGGTTRGARKGWNSVAPSWPHPPAFSHGSHSRRRGEAGRGSEGLRPLAGQP